MLGFCQFDRMSQTPFGGLPVVDDSPFSKRDLNFGVHLNVTFASDAAPLV